MARFFHGVWIVSTLLLLGACGSSNPPDDQLAELVEIEEDRLVNAAVETVDDLTGNWIVVTGNATVRNDLFVQVEAERGGELCGVNADDFDNARFATGQDFPLSIVEPGMFGGQLAEFEVELVPEQVDENNIDQDGNLTSEDRLTS